MRSRVVSAMNSMWPLPLVMPSRREAVLVGVAKRRVLDALFGADVACHDGAAVEPDAHHEAVVVALLGDPRVEALSRGPIISAAATSARSAWSGCSIGAPNTAMMPSPMYEISVPPAARIASVISLR